LTATGDTLAIGQPKGDETNTGQPEAVRDNPLRALKAQRLPSFSLKTSSEARQAFGIKALTRYDRPARAAGTADQA
jgi:hypothetical protein